MRKLPAILILILVMTCFAQNRNAQDVWQNADLAIVRLSPTAFRRLPRNIIRNLQARGCTIPQTFEGGEPHNVIRGEFARKGQTDWAVLCSHHRVSSILVFWGSSARRVSEIAKAADMTYLQTIGGGGGIGFSRAIEAVGGDYILEHYRAYGGPKPPRINHQGIDDAYIEKASVVRYYHRGRWLELHGAD